ncbi:MAG TPA: aminotransferase class V-fold PLP-dependent enzyme [Oscillatoriales cyanobacterium M59_W2019_021]|nr:MAG: aminotransferase class V-fold PLP-dependent enzyme [Cyanobacteria bacterium J055]HIK32909.1 aminotransferase class V-fold PLP-dependent enzyme [Oscillatoriales cyanobacterium M4454_W2019_049]HIK52008.1 aminotransferase class V-fold PLP-dependent enzyme [Oscillatoriales cyanobacterium M59_W2019_021]
MPIPNPLNSYRQQFPGLSNKAYFNYGGQGPLPRQASQAIARAYELLQELGPFSVKSYDWIEEQAQATRGAIAAELGVAPTEITLTEDVTVGCNIALWGRDWQPGEHVLLSDCEHPGIVAAVGELQRRYGIEVSRCPLQATLNDGDPVDAVLRNLKPQTRFVVLSHILWNTGQVLPLGAIVAACRQVDPDICILVDAAQSVGVLPLNLAEIGADFYAFTGHKWWCGPEGIGGLYVRPEARETLHPTFIGWRGITKDATGNPTGWQPDGRRFEIATSAYPLYAGLQAAIALHHQWGTAEERYRQICRSSEILRSKLAAISAVTCLKKSPPEAGLVSFTLADRSHLKLVKVLETQGLFARTILDPDCVRACVHYFTTEDEIDRLVEAIDRFCSKR